MSAETFALVYLCCALFTAAFTFALAYVHARDMDLVLVLVLVVLAALAWPFAIIFLAIEYFNKKWWRA